MSPSLDMPDDYPWLPGSSRSPLTDLGELAVRLGSVVSYDRRGEVIWLETFEDGIEKWQGVTGGAGSSVAVDITYPFHSANSCKLVAGGVSGGLAAIYRSFFSLEDYRWGGYASVGFFATFDRFLLEIYRRFDGVDYIAALQVSNTDKKLRYRNAAGNYVDLASLPAIVFSNGLYHQIKVVADFDKQEYMRAFFNESEYNLVGEAIYQVAAVATPRNMLLLTLYSDGVGAATARVGAAVLTGNEP